MQVRSRGSTEPQRNPQSLCRADVTLLLAAGVLVRLLLLAFGRFYVDDSFYLRNAWMLGRGARPYEDFVHVAFPLVEWVYAPFLHLGVFPLHAASLVTGAAVIVTSLLVARLGAALAGRRAGVIAGLLYLVAAPVLAWHLFERELWTSLGLAAAGCVLLARAGGPGGDGRAAAGGLLLALTLAFKLTAGVAAGALLLETWLRRRRDGLVATAFLCGGLAAATLLFAARYDGEFLVQVFLFYFFRGAEGDLAARAVTLARQVDPTLALGLAGMVVALARRDPRPRVAMLLAMAWLGWYALLSSTFWNHNALDLVLPAALAAGVLVDDLVRRPRPALVLLALLAVLAGAHGVTRQLPGWFPHRFGERNVPVAPRLAALLAEHTRAADLVLAPTPLVGVLAGRRSFVGDFELEPVARGLEQEVRRHGLLHAFARRRTGALLGAPAGTPQPDSAASLFTARAFANTLLHVVPRVVDAIRLRELAFVLPPLIPGVEATLRAAGYAPVDVGAKAFGFVRVPAPEDG